MTVATSGAWSVREVSRNVHEVHFEPHGKSGSWVGWAYLSSDDHVDSIHCRRDVMDRHHREAADRGAAVIKLGDQFDAMGGKWDPRSSLADLVPELRVNDYLDRAVEYVADAYEPIRENLAVLGYGNHETAIIKRHHVDLNDRLASLIRARGGIARAGGYTGWIRFRFCQREGIGTDSFVVHYDHGWGGGGPVTLGTIDRNRKAQYIVDADLVAMGHIHRRMHVTEERVGINSHSRLIRRAFHFLRCGTYKDEYGDGSGLGPIAGDPSAGSSDFHCGRGQGPRSLGGYWLRFSLCRPLKQNKVQVQVIPAV